MSPGRCILYASRSIGVCACVYSVCVSLITFRWATSLICIRMHTHTHIYISTHVYSYKLKYIYIYSRPLRATILTCFKTFMRGHESVCSVIVSPYGWYIFLCVRGVCFFFLWSYITNTYNYRFPSPSPHIYSFGPRILFVFIRREFITAHRQHGHGAAVAVAPND